MIEEYLKEFGFLSRKEINAFLGKLKPAELKKGEFLIEAGKTSKHIAFIKSGIFRSYYLSTELEDVTYCFTGENKLITAYTSWITQQPTIENIEAITDMELLLISKSSVLELEAKYPNWIRLFKEIAENEYMGLEQRIFMLQRESAEIRYQHLMKSNPSYFNQIPVQYIASYLGVTRRHLSRIRKKNHFGTYVP